MPSKKNSDPRKSASVKIAFLCNNCGGYGTHEVPKSDIENMEVKCPKCGNLDPDWMVLSSKVKDAHSKINSQKANSIKMNYGRLIQVIPTNGKYSAALVGSSLHYISGRLEEVAAWGIFEVCPHPKNSTLALYPILASGDILIPGKEDSSGWATFTGRYFPTPKDGQVCKDAEEFLSNLRWPHTRE